MKLELDEDLIRTAVAQAAANAITSGIESWDVRNRLEAAMKGIIDEVELVKLFESAMRERLENEAETVVREAVVEAVPAIKAGLRVLTRASMAAMVYGLHRGLPEEGRYMQDDDKAALAQAKKLLKIDEESQT